MSEITFVVDEAPEASLAALAVGESIFTQAATMAGFHGKVHDAVRCQFDQARQLEIVRLRVEANT